MGESDRGLCCLFFNGQNDCATRCSGRSCTDVCTVNCGIARTQCGQWTCSAVTTACTTTTTTTTTTATCSSSSTCASGGGSGCESGITCYDGSNILNANCCGQAANYCPPQPAVSPGTVITCP